jgi:hypothetical protein
LGASCYEEQQPKQKEVGMKYEGMIISRVIVLLLLPAACSPSDAQIATTIAQTELAKPTATVTPEPTATPTQPATPTKWPTSMPHPTNTSTWDRYKPRTIGQIAGNTEDELTSLADQAFYYNFGDDYASKVVATYTGQFRLTSERRLLLIGAWFEALITRFSRTDAINLFATEGLFIEDTIDYWLPIQRPLIPLMRDELTEGKPVTLFIIWIGATSFSNEIDRVFLLNEFLATSGAIPTLSLETTPLPPPTESVPSPQPGVTRIEVYGDQDWQDTGVSVQVNDTVEVKYISGTWSINPSWGYVDPDGHSFAPHPLNPIPDAQPGELIGRIGQSLFRIGRQAEFVARDQGHLYLRMNDDILSDNDGVLRVQITVRKP